MKISYKENMLSEFVVKMVKKRLLALLRYDRGSRKMFVDCGRQEGHTTAAFELYKELNKFFTIDLANNGVMMIGFSKESIRPFTYQGWTGYTAGTVKSSELKGIKSTFVIVDDYKHVRELVPNIENIIDLTNPIFTVYLQ